MLLKTLLDIVFPPLCHLCRSYIPDAGAAHICQGCRSRLTILESPLCSHCGIPFAGGGGDHPCGGCITAPPSFDAARAAFVYDGPCRDLIHTFKYGNKTGLRRPLALLTIEQLESFVRERTPDVILPVPLHRRRLRSRGFNQAVLLSELFSRHWGIPLDRYNLRRIRWTEPQVNLAAGDRRENVKGAFAVSDSDGLKGRRVLLVDDVCTTGSTADECATVLKNAGVSDVTLLTIARALT